MLQNCSSAKGLCGLGASFCAPVPEVLIYKPGELGTDLSTCWPQIVTLSVVVSYGLV
jgi:hypothetical protein